MNISAIIVAFNEEALVSRIIEVLKAQIFAGNYEIILADGGSTDATVELAKAEGVQVIVSDRAGKAHQMNASAKEASGDVLFFVHADMQFSSSVLESIDSTIDSGYDGGGFANIFDTSNEKIKRIGSLMNFRIFDKREQSDKGIFYGDNGIFVKRTVFEKLGGFREIPIMEDYDFSRRMSKEYKTMKIQEPSITVSARRHIMTGFVKTRLQWILVRKLYKWGISPKVLARWYQDVR